MPIRYQQIRPKIIVRKPKEVKEVKEEPKISLDLLESYAENRLHLDNNLMEIIVLKDKVIEKMNEENERKKQEFIKQLDNLEKKIDSLDKPKEKEKPKVKPKEKPKEKPKVQTRFRL